MLVIAIPINGAATSKVEVISFVAVDTVFPLLVATVASSFLMAISSSSLLRVIVFHSFYVDTVILKKTNYGFVSYFVFLL